MRSPITIVTLLWFALSSPLALAQAPEPAPAAVGGDCGSLRNAIGPFDYREALNERSRGNLSHPAAAALIGIEDRYLTEEVETLKANNSVQAVNISLRAFPNHHRGLWAAVRLQRRLGTPKLGDPNRLSAECYLQRALAVAPDDGLVWMLWGVYLHQHERYRDAIGKYRQALELGVESAELNYNLGLALLKINDVDGALEQARIAYAQNYPLRGLQRKLIKLGVWNR